MADVSFMIFMNFSIFITRLLGFTTRLGLFNCLVPDVALALPRWIMAFCDCWWLIA